MPVHVTTWALNGKKGECSLPGSTKFRDLKKMIYYSTGAKPSLTQLIAPPSRLCDEETDLLDLVDCPLADLLDPQAEENILLELELQVLTISNACFVCEAAPARRCAGCRLARYCSRACQVRDWRHHKAQCKACLGIS